MSLFAFDFLFLFSVSSSSSRSVASRLGLSRLVAAKIYVHLSLCAAASCGRRRSRRVERRRQVFATRNATLALRDESRPNVTRLVVAAVDLPHLNSANSTQLDTADESIDDLQRVTRSATAGKLLGGACLCCELAGHLRSST